MHRRLLPSARDGAGTRKERTRRNNPRARTLLAVELLTLEFSGVPSASAGGTGNDSQQVLHRGPAGESARAAMRARPRETEKSPLTEPRRRLGYSTPPLEKAGATRPPRLVPIFPLPLRAPASAATREAPLSAKREDDHPDRLARSPRERHRLEPNGDGSSEESC